MSDERKISERYREASREEPPRHLDAAILAAARRAAGTRPAPLVVPSGRQRWYFPLAAAAIIVLAVAVTMHVEREQPDPEVQGVAPEVAAKEYAMQPQPQASVKPEPAPAPESKAPPRVFAPDPKPAPSRGAKREDAPLADLRKEKAQTPPPPAAAPPAPPQRDAIGRASEGARADVEARAQRRAESSVAARARQAPSDVQEAPGVSSGAIANYATMPPEQALQGIADLRRQGKHEEADKALAEFRKRYPDYRISEEMLEKVERR